jgi:tellurite resistance protein TehA-like permease
MYTSTTLGVIAVAAVIAAVALAVVVVFMLARSAKPLRIDPRVPLVLSSITVVGAIAVGVINLMNDGSVLWPIWSAVMAVFSVLGIRKALKDRKAERDSTDPID